MSELDERILLQDVADEQTNLGLHQTDPTHSNSAAWPDLSTQARHAVTHGTKLCNDGRLSRCKQVTDSLQ